MPYKVLESIAHLLEKVMFSSFLPRIREVECREVSP